MSQSGGNAATDVLPGPTSSAVSGSSGLVAAAAAVASLPAVAGKTAWLTGFEVTAAGSTAALTVDVAVTGLVTPLHYAFTFPAGAGVGALPLVIDFPRPVPASGVNTAIVITCPSGGVGNLAAAVVAHGLYL